MISASQAHLSVTKELLTATAGANVDAVNKQQHTALTLACDHDHLDILRLLLCYGADFNKQDRECLKPAFSCFLCWQLVTFGVLLD
ncbi:hypothetical protein WJX77_005474 [Trebouxia sp. C0004]